MQFKVIWFISFGLHPSACDFVVTALIIEKNEKQLFDWNEVLKTYVGANRDKQTAFSQATGSNSVPVDYLPLQCFLWNGYWLLHFLPLMFIKEKPNKKRKIVSSLSTYVKKLQNSFIWLKKFPICHHSDFYCQSNKVIVPYLNLYIFSRKK